jgi:selenocysteine lyase/cysteine desulfurase
VYLDNAFVGLMPRQVKEGYDSYVEEWFTFNPEKRTILDSWLDKSRLVRGKIAEFIKVDREEIALTMCTGSGLNIIINGLDWSKGDNAVFSEFEHNPLDTFSTRKQGVEPRVVHSQNGGFDMADFENAIDNDTKLVQVSQVCYTNGYRFDLRELANIAHEHGSKLLVDATQAVGALQVDYRKDDVDFVSVAPYKYLLGPAGLAFLYVKKENLSDLIPDRTGWKNQIWEGELAEDPVSLDTAEKFEYGTIHFQGAYVLERCLQYLTDIGIDNIEKRNLMLSNYLMDEIAEREIDLYTPEGNKSPIVSYFQKDARRLASELMSKKVKVTGRDTHGGHMRLGVHFYNTRKDIDEYFNKIETL